MKPEEKPYQELGNLYLNMEKLGKNEDMINAFPQLRKWKEFVNFGGTPAGELHKDKTIRYINIFYSPGSKLTKTHKTNVVARKEEAATIAGFNLKDEKESEKVRNDLFGFKSKSIFAMVMLFVKNQPGKDYVWESIISREQFYWELQSTVLEPLTGDDENKRIASMEKKSKLLNAKEEQRQALKGLYKEFFGDDFELEEVFKSDELMLCTPEEIATIPRPF